VLELRNLTGYVTILHSLTPAWFICSHGRSRDIIYAE
jgi:hypothetical protein